MHDTHRFGCGHKGFAGFRFHIYGWTLSKGIQTPTLNFLSIFLDIRFFSKYCKKNCKSDVYFPRHICLYRPSGRKAHMKLTEKQKQVLGYISRYIDMWETAPSFDEICTEFGFRSYNTVTTYLKTLERKGYIRLPGKKNRRRAIEVISPVETRRFEFPLLGKVAAGKPIEAVEDVSVIEIPPSMARNGEHFVLQVKGNSMQEDGIMDGDFVVVKKQPTAENGQTVVAVIDNEATVKKYYKKRTFTELRPAHSGMAPIRVEEGDLRIMGRVVGVLRYL